jgi:hypothetical protein
VRLFFFLFFFHRQKEKPTVLFFSSPKWQNQFRTFADISVRAKSFQISRLESVKGTTVKYPASAKPF